MPNARNGNEPLAKLLLILISEVTTCIRIQQVTHGDTEQGSADNLNYDVHHLLRTAYRVVVSITDGRQSGHHIVHADDDSFLRIIIF